MSSGWTGPSNPAYWRNNYHFADGARQQLQQAAQSMHAALLDAIALYDEEEVYDWPLAGAHLRDTIAAIVADPPGPTTFGL